MKDLFGDSVIAPKKRDWSGDTNSVFKTLASSHHTKDDRQENDYYATDPKAVTMLMEIEHFDLAIPILEPACGEGHLSKELVRMGYHVLNLDIIDRGFKDCFEQMDFLETKTWPGNIITNPPYSMAKEFIQHALSITTDGCKIAMFLKVTFMEGKGRKQMFIDTPPKTIHISSSRINCGKNGDFEDMRKNGGSAVAYAWYVWEKGFKGTTQLKWFN